MDKVFSEKINLLKALAIALVVSGHLEFSIFSMFPPYSFQIALFFFISGMLFKDIYLNNVCEYIKRRAKSLLVPYFLYSAFYAIITILIAKLTGKFWGMELNLKNFVITPFLNGHQLDFSCPMWFVPQLFITLIVFLFLERNIPQKIKTAFYIFLCLISVPIAKNFPHTAALLVVIRTMFSLFFVHLGHLYTQKIRGKHNVFTPKFLAIAICLQALLWLFNQDYDPAQGIGLSYILVWGDFHNNAIIPLLTSLTGIWFSCFFIEITYQFIKNIKFMKQVGKNTYHIMANHLFVMYIITVVLLKLNGVPISEKNAHDIYWIYNPVQTTFLYFILTMIVTTLVGCGLNRLHCLYASKKT